jgi:hypothetical protein
MIAGKMKNLISFHLHLKPTLRFLFSSQSIGKNIKVLMIMGTNATVTSFMLDPISRITGTCVAHIKFTRMTSNQSKVL